MLVSPDTLSGLGIPEGHSPQVSGSPLLPPLRVQPQLVPDVLVVDIGICPAASQNARSGFPAPDR